MKKQIFLACAALVVSAAAVVGVKAYNRSQMSDLALANIEALSDEENILIIKAAINIKFGCDEKFNSMCTIICPMCNTRWASYEEGSFLDKELTSIKGYCEAKDCGHYFYKKQQ